MLLKGQCLLRSVLGWLRHFTPKLHSTNTAFYNGVMHFQMSRPLIILSFVAMLVSCQTTNFGKCVESSSSVSPACLYEGGYPSCQLNDEQYELARKNAWEYEEAGFNDDYFVNTGKSQDLGSVCRFYIRVKPGHTPIEPYQWLVYIDKRTFKATHMLAVKY